MKKIITPFVIAIALVSFANTPDDTAIRMVKALSVLDGSDKSDADLDAELAPLRNQVTKEQYIQIRTEVRNIVIKSLADPQLLQQVANVYEPYFTQEEMETIIEFYGSSAWKKIIENKDEIDRKKQQVIDAYIAQSLEKKMSSKMDEILGK